MKERYYSFQDYCIAYQNAQNSEKIIVNGWDCTMLPESAVEILKTYDSLESLKNDIYEHGEYLPKFHLYAFKGKRFDYQCFEHIGFRLLIEGCHMGNEFVLEPLIRTGANC